VDADHHRLRKLGLDLRPAAPKLKMFSALQEKANLCKAVASTIQKYAPGLGTILCGFEIIPKALKDGLMFEPEEDAALAAAAAADDGSATGPTTAAYADGRDDDLDPIDDTALPSAGAAEAVLNAGGADATPAIDVDMLGEDEAATDKMAPDSRWKNEFEVEVLEAISELPQLTHLPSLRSKELADFLETAKVNLKDAQKAEKWAFEDYTRCCSNLVKAIESLPEQQIDPLPHDIQPIYTMTGNEIQLHKPVWIAAMQASVTAESECATARAHLAKWKTTIASLREFTLKCEKLRRKLKEDEEAAKVKAAEAAKVKAATEAQAQAQAQAQEEAAAAAKAPAAAACTLDTALPDQLPNERLHSTSASVTSEFPSAPLDAKIVKFVNMYEEDADEAKRIVNFLCNIVHVRCSQAYPHSHYPAHPLCAVLTLANFVAGGSI
jgi:biotin carboxyl carrier protein